MGISMKNTRSADFCVDQIDVITNFAVITNVVIKRVHCICISFSVGGHGTLGLRVQEDRKIVDNLVNEIRKGKVLRRLSMRQKSGDAKK